MHLRLRRAMCYDGACNEHGDVCKPHTAARTILLHNKFIFTQYLVNINIYILYTHIFKHIDTVIKYCVCGGMH